MKHKSYLLLLLISAVTLGACGGGGSADSGGIGGTGVTSTGVMTKGSIVVNGVRYEVSSASNTSDDSFSSSNTPDDGKVVKLRGRRNDDGINGTAERFEIENEVRGTVTATSPGTSPQTFTVVGQTVIIDDLTIYGNFSSVKPANPLGEMTVNSTVVEVHGLRLGNGNIQASRVEKLSVSPGTVDELRGRVSSPSGNTFTLVNGSSSVNVINNSATVVSNGQLVEIHGSYNAGTNTFTATRVDLEDSEDSSYNPGSGGQFEVEGLIAGFTGHPGAFSVAGVSVTTSGSTLFKGGVAADLGNDIKVEAEGTWNGSTLVARKIQFKRSVIRLQGTPTPPSAGGTFEMQIQGLVGTVTVETDSNTSGTIPTGGEICVQVRANRKAVAGKVVIAGEIDLTCSSSGRHFIQAPVEAESGTTLTLLGYAINLGGGGIQFEDVNDNVISQSQFFDIVTPAGINSANVPVAGTLVKVRFDGGLVDEAEIED